MKVPDKDEKVPGLAPACLIGCAAYGLTFCAKQNYTFYLMSPIAGEVLFLGALHAFVCLFLC